MKMEISSRDVAIIGMSCRFPGHSNDLNSFWTLLASGGDGITTTDCRWGDDVALPTSKYGGFIDDVASFDAAFFNILPKEALKKDPQQRVLLGLHWEALESACIPPEQLRGSETGVFAGMAWNDYEKLCHSTKVEPSKLTDHHDLYLTTGTAHALGPGFVSFFFDLRGPSMAVDTASSSSLISMHLAVQALLSGECSMAFASGVCLNLSPEIATSFTQSHMLSDRSRVFDADARGYCRSEGAAVVLLKRIDDALRDGNRVFGVVKASALNQNGKGPTGITAPNPYAQQKLYLRTLSLAGLNPQDVQYIETHGTGTPVGDPAELQSLVAVYGNKNGSSKAQMTGVGSIKTNIGHTEMAAGLAGVIKTILSLQNEFIPPHIHFKEQTKKAPNLLEHGLEILAKGRIWPRKEGRPRLAAVSSFGLFGSNAHVILGEGPAESMPSTPPAWGILTVSARTKWSHDTLLQKYRQYFQAGIALGLVADAVYTSNVGRTHFRQHRTAFVLNKDQLGGSALDLGKCHKVEGISSKGEELAPIYFILTGMSCPESQSLGIALYNSTIQCLFKKELAECVRLSDNLQLIVATKSTESDILELKQPEHRLLFLFILETCIFKTLTACGLAPSKYICYGLGEYVGAYLAGVINLKDALKLVALLDLEVLNGSNVKYFDVLLAQTGSGVTNDPESHGLHIHQAFLLSNGNTNSSTDISLWFGNAAQVEARAVEKFGTVLPELRFCMPTVNAKKIIEFASTVEYQVPPRGVELVFASGKPSMDSSVWLESRFSALPGKKNVSIHLPVASIPTNSKVVRPPLQILLGTHKIIGVSETTTSLTSEMDVGLLFAQAYGSGHNLRWDIIHCGSSRGKLVELPKYAFEKRVFWYPSKLLTRTKISNSHSDPAKVKDDRSDKSGSSSVVPMGVRSESGVRARLIEMLMERTGLEKGDIEEEWGFAELGMDSIRIREYGAMVAKEFGLNNGTQLVQDHDTILKLIQHISKVRN